MPYEKERGVGLAAPATNPTPATARQNHPKVTFLRSKHFPWREFSQTGSCNPCGAPPAFAGTAVQKVKTLHPFSSSAYKAVSILAEHP